MRVVGIFLLSLAMSGCYLYFDDDDRDPPPTDAGVWTDSAPPIDGPCEYPDYSTDCAAVPYFQCGFAATCEGDTVVVTWHEHVYCSAEEDIVEFSCTYDCPTSCIEGGDWPLNGAALIADWCAEEPPPPSSCEGSCGESFADCSCAEGCEADTSCCADYAELCAPCVGLGEEECSASPSCKPVYSGTNCTDPDGNTCTSGDTNCTCESFEFAVCIEK